MARSSKRLRVTDVDRHVGKRLREIRQSKELSLEQLAKKLDISYQQIEKYEKGLNRISAGRLYEIATILGVSVSWFFEVLAGPQSASEQDHLHRTSVELGRNFALIENEGLRQALLGMARAMANGTKSP